MICNIIYSREHRPNPPRGPSCSAVFTPAKGSRALVYQGRSSML